MEPKLGLRQLLHMIMVCGNSRSIECVPLVFDPWSCQVPPLRKHQESQGNDGHTGSWCLAIEQWKVQQ